MLATKCVVDNFKMLVTVLAFFVANIHYFYIILQPRCATNDKKFHQVASNLLQTKGGQ